ncbi:MAG TPA: hypothetical protein VFV67_06655 [Actinophytocola sp.]|uniref:Rv2732c family membrane protein n=1 Tax=Actinophytocola sp. TaxID=1872138 RepID=UPI002DBE0F7D|nr:hypothetical protein [Actinophytocola sp.]HEU5470315.1 hypothetical protein [Actinophytocola sp.]
MSENESPELAGLREEIDEVERTTVRTVELGMRGLVIAIAVFVLLVGEILPWMDGANGLQVLVGQGGATGKASMVPRLFAGASLTFGVLASALALMTRRWRLTWVCALGGWFATVTGVLAIWSRQSGGGQGPGIGLIIAVVATVTIAVLWFRTAWSRS